MGRSRAPGPEARLKMVLNGRVRQLLAALGGLSVGGIMLAMVVNLVLGFATKAPCLAPWPAGGIPSYCYSDVLHLYDIRGLAAHIFPYIHGVYAEAPDGQVFLGHGEIEYPVLIGLFTWATALPFVGHDSFFLVDSGALAVCGLVCVWLMTKLAGNRVLLFVLAPGVVFFGFINWDFISVLLAVGGIYLWHRHRPVPASIVFAVGGCFKLWPAFFILPLVADYWSREGRRRAIEVAVPGIAAGLAINLPFMVINFRGWYAPYAFQAGIQPYISGSLWDWDGRYLGAHMVDLLSDSLALAGFVVIMAYGWRTARRTGIFPFLQSCGALVVWYLLTAKDSSPQYVLWILPFFVLLELRPSLWVQLCIGSFLWYVTFMPIPEGIYTVVMWVLAALRATTYMLIIWNCLRAPLALSTLQGEEPPEPVVTWADRVMVGAPLLSGRG